MKDEFTNRLGAFRTTIDYLFAPANNVKWNGQPPLRFGKRAAEAAGAVNALAEFCQRQSVVITGAAADKAREEKELEDAVFVLGQAVAECCRSLGHEADAAKCGFPISTWRGMRDAHLLATAREVIRIATAVMNGPNAAAAAECGITPQSVAACQKEADDYQAVITAPQQGIASRKALTGLLRDRFNEVEAIFAAMDGLVEQFTDRTFVQGYHAARTVRDAGHGPTPTPPAPPPTPPA